MKEILRVRCPICGMMPSLDNLAQTAEKEAEIRLYMQKIYGKKPAPAGEEFKKKGRGKAPGWIEYEDITEQAPDQVDRLKTFFDKRIAEFQGKLSEG